MIFVYKNDVWYKVVFSSVLSFIYRLFNRRKKVKND